MNVFEEYKPFRNKFTKLAVDDSLIVIWAYSQYLQTNNFQFPVDIEVADRYLQLDIPQKWLSEWELELLAKEVVLNGSLVATKGRSLRKWTILSELVNSLKSFENEIYGQFSSQDDDVLVELIRIAHRQFLWQSNSPNASSFIRYFKIFNRQKINEICGKKIGLTIKQIYMCGLVLMGIFLKRPALLLPSNDETRSLSSDEFQRFFSFVAKPINALKSQLKSGQQFNANFAYAYNSLRTFPLIKIGYQAKEVLFCPLTTLLYWRFTGGLYYELINVPEFANEFGDGFQQYVGEVIERACPPPMRCIGEEEYSIGKARKRSVDWIVVDHDAALFIECKAKRLSWGAKQSLLDLQPLESDVQNMASAIVQVYKTLVDYLNNAYLHFPVEDRYKLFPLVVTLENWRMFGPVMLNKLAEAVASTLSKANLPADLVERMPYSVWAVEELEAGLQIMGIAGIKAFMEGKLENAEKRRWDWFAYMRNQYPASFPTKKLFKDDYRQTFSEIYRGMD